MSDEETPADKPVTITQEMIDALDELPELQPSHPVNMPVNDLVAKMSKMHTELLKAFHCMIGDIPCTISFILLQPKPYWDSRDTIFSLVDHSESIYRSLSAMQREVLKDKIRQALGVMHDEIDQWLPNGLSMDETGQTIRVELNFLAAEIDKDVKLLEQVTTFKIRAAQKESLAAMKELKVGPQ